MFAKYFLMIFLVVVMLSSTYALDLEDHTYEETQGTARRILPLKSGNLGADF